MSKEKAIALMIAGYLLLILLFTMALVEVEKLQERVNIIETNNLSTVNKNSLKTILERSAKDREVVQLLRKDFDNWSLMWNEMFEGRK
jgi:LPS O-antigen subunit length determinant protein (WzzB/FepE family)